MNNEDLGRNLRLLCSYYTSVAEVCRRLEINRPQFNRYLSGRYKPSANTMRRFCEFFGVEEHEMLLPHSQFKLMVQVRPNDRAGDAHSALEMQHLDLILYIVVPKIEASCRPPWDEFLRRWED